MSRCVASRIRTTSTMYFDALTLAAVADELQATILGGRIQRVLMPGTLSIGMEVYAQRTRYHLLASAHPQFARVHLLTGKPSRGVEHATPLLLLLRKYALGGRIVAIEQPPLERMLVLSIVKEGGSGNPMDHMDQNVPDQSEELPEPLEQHDPQQPDDAAVEVAHNPEHMLRCELIIEPMERRSNIILVDDANVILDSVKRVTPRMSQRVILPRQPYETPPQQEKRDPRTATGNGIAALQDQGKPELVRALVAGYRGVSPQAAREIVYRAMGATDVALHEALPWDTIAACMREVFGAPWEPTLIPGEERPRAYAPYALFHMAGGKQQPGMSAALEAFYQASEHVTAHNQRRDVVQKELGATRERLQHQLTQISNELATVENLEHLRWEGEMILAFMHTLAPGQSTLEVEGRKIDLGDLGSDKPLDAAQTRFRRYNRAKTGRESLQERKQATEMQLDGLEQLIALLSVADGREQIDQIALEAEEQGYIQTSGSGKKARARQKRPTRRKPLRLVTSDGFDIYIGRSGEQNAEVTFRIGRPDDLWLHVRSIPGAHVIVRTGGRDVPERSLEEAAGIAAYFSPLREDSAVEVDVSWRKQVRKIAGAPPGLVTYRAERTLRVQPIPPWS